MTEDDKKKAAEQKLRRALKSKAVEVQPDMKKGLKRIQAKIEKKKGDK